MATSVRFKSLVSQNTKAKMPSDEAPVCAILLELFGVPLLELFFANNIAEYAYLLTPMIISAVIAAYLWFLSDLLIAIRDFRGNFIGNAASLVVAVACMVPFVAAWGMNGVSFTVAASSLAGAVAMARRRAYFMPVWNPPARPRFAGSEITLNPRSRQMASVASVEPSLMTT